MPVPRNVGRDQAADFGIQEYLVIDAVPSSAEDAKKGVIAKDAGSLAVAGNYDMVVETWGLTDIEVFLRTSALSGTVTSSVFSTYADGSTSKTAGTGVGALVNATRQTVTLSGLKGVRKVIVRLIVSGGASCTLDQAEVNGR